MTTIRAAAALVAGAAGAGWVWTHARSPAVASWRESDVPRRTVRKLSCRAGGAGLDVAVLIHGLVGTGDVFGRSVDRLATHFSVVVPDLPGFGRSLHAEVPLSDSADLIDAVDGVVHELARGRPIVLGAHSMGASIALQWAANNPVRVRRVVCLGAPMWPSAPAARRAIGGAGLMARMFIVNERIARQICRINCNHRVLSGWAAAALAPKWPVPIARQASLHTWDSYRRAFTDHVLGTDWEGLLRELNDHEVKVLLIWGSEDPVGDPSYAERVTADLRNVSIEMLENADHTLPASRPDLLADRLMR